MAQELNANSLCFILTPDGYEEITYSELCQRRDNDITYQDKKFLLLYGMLLEVTEADYIDFHRNKRREKYLKEQSAKRGDILFSSLDSDEFNGEDMLVDTEEDIAAQVADKLLKEKLHEVLPLLPEDERKLIHEHFFLEIPQVELAKKYGKCQSNISRKITRILLKIKFLLEK